MKEKIERFAKGNFEYDNPSICLSEYELNITAEAGKITEGSFFVRNSTNKRMKGSVYSSDNHMKLVNPIFNDAENEIKYIFDASYLEAGTNVSGCFTIISDCGECTLNYNIAVEQGAIQLPGGKMSELDQFASLARMDWVEAKRIFRSQDFERIFLNEEQAYIYRHLIKSVSTSQALEEFLVSIQKKNPIYLEIEKSNLEYNAGKEDIVDKLVLTKNEWGYAEIRVSCDAPFIQLDQKYLWSDRFIGNSHQIIFTIDVGQLKKGNNHGHIYIKTPLQTLTVNVSCNNNTGMEPKYRLHKRAKAELVANYLNFRLSRTELKDYLDKAQAVLKYLPEPGDGYIKELTRLHLAILAGKSDLAKAVIAQLSEEEAEMKKGTVLDYCAYLYLNALYRKTADAIDEATRTIRSYYLKGYNDWRMLWLLLYIDKRYENNRALVLEEIKEQYMDGCRSPIMYYEAICCYNEEPSLLRELSGFEIQALNYGTKNDMLSLELVSQFTYLAGRKKTFNSVIYRCLERLYDKYGTEDILFAICSLLIKGMKRSEKYFKWFRLGVRSQLKITGLYEYYMYSIREDYQEAIDQQVMLYYIYNSSLNEHKAALLYSNIIKSKRDNEHIYRSYCRRMEVFARKMLEKHLINDHLAVLYNEFAGRIIHEDAIAEHLSHVIFRNELCCANPNMVSATILYKELDAEETVQLVNGRAQLNIFSDNFEIFFADSFGNRYIQSMSYELRPYLKPEEYADQCIKKSHHPMLLLYMYGRYQERQIPDTDAIDLIEKVLEIETLAPGLKAQCLITLIKHYDEADNEERLISCLDRLDMGSLSADERIRLISLMIERAYYDRALRAVEIFGYDGLALNLLIKLCSGWLHTYGTDEKNPFLLSLCYFIFAKSKYDDIILSYLVKFYRGSTGSMLKLLQAAKDFELDSHRLSQRLLAQMLFCENHIEDSFAVFCDYYRDVSNRLLVRAYLTYHAYRYLVHNHEIADEIFPLMRRELSYEENEVCLLAWLKKNAANQELSETDLRFAEINIERLVRKGIIMPFFLEYKDRLSLPDTVFGKHYITYVTKPGNQVYIHYDMGYGSEYVTERMPDIFMGIHMKELVLFYNDEVRYYISEETPEGIKKGEECSFRYVCDVTDEPTKYNQINKMLIALEKKQNSELLAMMENYLKTEYMIGACFRQI
mgnify:FL=1